MRGSLCHLSSSLNYLPQTRLLSSKLPSIPWTMEPITPCSTRKLSTFQRSQPCLRRSSMLLKTSVSSVSIGHPSFSIWLFIFTGQLAFGELAFTLDHLSVVDIVVKNGDAGKHPLYVLFLTPPGAMSLNFLPHSHIHGHKFQVVNRGDDYTSNDTTLNPPLKEGQANPISRDTIQILSMHSATLRFVADNPGAWLFHCHIDWHLSSVGLSNSR